MRRFFQSISQSRTLRAQAILVGGNFLANIGAYFYHLMMGRLLVPSDYGALQSLISLTNIFTVPLVTLNFVVTKFVSGYFGRGEDAKISYIFHQTQKILVIVAIVGGSTFLFIANPILTFLHIDSWINFLFLDIVLFFGLLTTLNRSVLQGLSKFFPLTIAQFIDAYGKLILGVIALSLGFRVSGAFGAFVLVLFISYIYTSYIVNHLISKKEKSLDISYKQMIKYGVLSFVMTISMISLYNADVVLVRHFFSSYDSGLYAALSILGKIIFFASAPVAVAMFPLVSVAQARGEKYHKIFLQSFLIIILMAGSATILFSLFPALVLKILVGPKYLDAAPYLPIFSIFLSLCAVVNLISSFFLSIRKTLPAFILGMGAILQILFISVYHPSLFVVIFISLAVLTALTIIFSVYYVAISRH